MGRYYILNPAGEFERLDFPGELKGFPVNLTPALYEALRTNLPVWIRNCFSDANGSLVSLCVANRMAFLSKPLPVLKLRANYKVDEKAKLVIPAWGDTTCPEFAIDWTPPAGMALRLGVEMSNDPGVTGTGDTRFVLYRAYLVAHNAAKACYKLPIPNLYDDLRICLPLDIPKTYPSLVECFDYVAQLVADSLWNNHLIKNRTHELENTPKLIRFTPNGTGFETLPPVERFELLLPTAGTQALEYLMP